MMGRAINYLHFYLIRGLLIMGVLLFPFSINAMEIKVSITPPSAKEYVVEVTDSTGLAQKKLTVNHEAVFDVREGIVTINIEGKKKIRKQVYIPSIIQILYYD